ncbi:MAG: DNA adenine methylase [Ignavibacteriales bacterium]|nr:MAG: DNA adenine methylase [Ignavibacteriales bacterium]
MNSAFGYYGAKLKIASQIIKFLPPHNAWVEAFCGSAAITIGKEQAPIEIINDLDDQVVNLFKQLRENSEELLRVVSLTPYARSEYFKAKEIDINDTSLEKARKFLVSTMMTVNGAVGKTGAGFSYCQSYTRSGKEARVNRWYNFPERIEKVIERLRNVRIENRDARELLNMFVNRPATLFYMDPPYLTDRTHKYNYDIDESFHIELLELSNKAKCMILISGYENELYNKLLSPQYGWIKTIVNTSTSDTSGKKYSRKEILWKNQYFEKAYNTNRIPIHLSNKERKENKVNPER